MTFTTNKFIITVSGNLITCDYRTEPQVKETTLSANGITAVNRPFSEIFHTSPLPYFTARYIPQYDEFDVDLDCGAQRWEGPKSIYEVQEALGKCGVAKNKVKAI